MIHTIMFVCNIIFQINIWIFIFISNDSLYERFNVTPSYIYLSILSRWIILISYSESCAFSSIILHKQFCECQTASWQQMHMWLSFWCIFLSYHKIGERAHIHLLYFSEFRNLVPTLVDPINFITKTNNVKNSWRIF